MRQAKFTKPLTIALPENVYDVLKEMSDTDRISMAECVRYILSEAVRPYIENTDSNLKKEDTNNE